MAASRKVIMPVSTASGGMVSAARGQSGAFHQVHTSDDGVEHDSGALVAGANGDALLIRGGFSVNGNVRRVRGKLRRESAAAGCVRQRHGTVECAQAIRTIGL